MSPATNLADHALHVLSSQPDVALKCADRLQAERTLPWCNSILYIESVSNQAGFHINKADGVGLRLLAGPARAVCPRVDHERARCWFGIQGLAHGFMDRLRGLFRWDGHEHELRDDLDIGAAHGAALCIEREYANGTYTAGSYWCARCVVCFGVCTLVGVLTTPIWYFLIGITMGPGLLTIMIASILAAFAFTTYANIVGALSSTPIAAANFAEPLVNGHAPLKWHHDHAAQDQEPLLPVLSDKPAVLALLYYCRGRDADHKRGVIMSWITSSTRKAK